MSPTTRGILWEIARAIRHPVRKIVLRGVYKRIEQLEYQSFNRRFFAIEQLTEYLIGAQISGDYLEFGVFQGTTFIHGFRNLSPHFKQIRFFAFDSFEGLPEPKGIDGLNEYSSHFYRGQFSCNEEEFRKHLKRNGVDLKKVTIVKGWFEETLSVDKAREYGIGTIAAAWIDCDLYESTVPVLKFISPHLTQGSVIIFDDWRCYRNHPDFGEQRACREWLEANPHIRLQELFSFGWNGIAFTVTSC